MAHSGGIIKTSTAAKVSKKLATAHHIFEMLVTKLELSWMTHMDKKDVNWSIGFNLVKTRVAPEMNF